MKQYKYYDLIMVVFVTVLIASNFIGAGKVWGITLFGKEYAVGAGIFFFPISYLFGDILTEVYGYARARKVVWAGFGALIFTQLMTWMVLALPPASAWPNQEAYETVFGSSGRIVLASITAYFCGEFCNSYVLAKMKVWMEGRILFARTIGSTVVGEAVDSVIFYPLAFWGVWAPELVIGVMLSNYVLKVLWEVAATPFTYWFVAWLKRREEVDYYDVDTNFTPFSIKTES